MARLESYAIYDPAAAVRWKALQDVAEVRSPFSDPRVASAVATVAQVDARLHFALDGDHDRAAVVTFTRKLGPLNRSVHPSLSYYTPLLLAARPAEAAVHDGSDDLSLLIDALTAAHVGVRLQLPPVVSDVRPAISRRLPTRAFYTYVIDPAVHDLAAWSASARRLFRRHREAFEFVRGSVSPVDVAHLAADAYQRHGRRPPFDPQRFDGAVTPLTESGLAETFSVRDSEGIVGGGVVLLRQGDSACYWIAGSRPGPAMTILMGFLLEHLAANQVKRFDLLGANTPSIAEFKRKFGPELRAFHHVGEGESPLWRLMRKVMRR